MSLQFSRDMLTPAGIMRRDGRTAYFRAVPLGAVFECNGNLWRKRSRRTAAGIWPASLPVWSYFRGTELCTHGPAPEAGQGKGRR